MDRAQALLLTDAAFVIAGVPWWHRLLGASHDEVRALLEQRPIKRHKTAIKRKSLSVPANRALQQGVLKQGMSWFDYGCGRGDDLRLLKQKGFDAAGWDPYYSPDTPRQRADVVNLGFVLNIIEDPDERDDTLRAAFKLAKSCLVVATRPSMKHSFKQYRDGYVTKLDTFQRFWSQSELKDYLAEQTGVEPKRLGSCCYSCCRSR